MSTYTTGHSDTQKARGALMWCKLRHRHTAAQTHTWVRWPQVQRRNQWSVHPEMIDLLIQPRWACFMFKMLLVQSWHHWWATTAEPLRLRHWKCSQNPTVSCTVWLQMHNHFKSKTINYPEMWLPLYQLVCLKQLFETFCTLLQKGCSFLMVFLSTYFTYPSIHPSQ